MKKKLFVLGFVIAFASCTVKETADQESANAPAVDKNLHAKALELFGTLPEMVTTVDNTITTIKTQLGKTLFYDNRLSKNNTQSCNTCHNLSTFGVDNQPTSKGDLGENGGRNSPTVYNAALHIAQFWDGRAKTVEEQAGMPILNPVEMNMPNEKFVEDRLKGIEGYRKMFAQAFPELAEPITYENMKKAIAAFERTLVTPGKFDKYLKGDLLALNETELKGLNEFINVGCTNCHAGVALGGAAFHKFPQYGNDYISMTGSAKEDLGKMEQSKVETDKFIFKAPSLLNITETGPYFHDGSVASLDKVILIMAKLQLNKELTAEQVKNIKAFLGTLKGDLPASAIISPVMP